MHAPTHKRGSAVDQEIFQAVIDLLATKGFLNLGIADVAKAAGVNKTTVYRRHKSIESLVFAALSSYAEQEVPLPDTGTLLGDFRALARSVKTLLDSPLGRALIQATADAALAELRQRYWSHRLARAATVIERATQRGECGEVSEPQAWIESLVAPIHFRIYQSQVHVSEEFLDAQATRVAQAIENLSRDEVGARS